MESHNTTLDQLLSDLRTHSQYKARSDETHDRDHAPLLAQNDDNDDNNKPITCLLLGHSFFERFKTTGRSTPFGPDRALYPEFFNAGIGGDKISNVIYRLTDKGLLDSLREKGGVKYALLALGTNDLQNNGKKPLQDVHVQQYELIVRTLRQICPGVKALVCGIAPRKKVKRKGIVEESNEMLVEMARRLNDEEQKDSGGVVEFLPANPALIDCLEPDGVHLNEEGYGIFGDELWERYQDMRARFG